MADSFTTLVALQQPSGTATKGKLVERFGGVSPAVKGSVQTSRQLAPGGKYGPKQLAVDAYTHALWRLDEASGTAADETGNYPLSATGSPTGIVAQVGNGRQFSSGNYLAGAAAAAPAIFDFGAEWTVEFWLNLTEAGIPNFNYRGVLALEREETAGGSGDAGPEIFIGSLFSEGPKFHVGTSYGRVRLGPVIPVNVLQHWAFRVLYSSPNYNIELYQNGVLAGTGSTTAVSSLTAGTWKWRLGRTISWGQFNGIIDEVRVSTVARSPAQILSSYEYGRGEL